MDRESVAKAAQNIKLIALDLDGTALDARGQFRPYTRRVVQTLLDRGYLVVPATGRGYHGLVDEVLGLNGVRYVISANGAFVTETSTGNILAEKLIPYKAAAALADALFAPDRCLYIHRNDPYSTHVMACADRERYRRDFWRAGMPAAEEILTESPRNFILADGRDVPKIGLIFAENPEFAGCEALTVRDHPAIRSFRVSEKSLEFCHKEASKAAALRCLAEHLGLAPQQLCALGDNGNDREMLQWAGLGVAMKNGLESTKEAADWLAESNEEDGAARFFATFLLHLDSSNK